MPLQDIHGHRRLLELLAGAIGRRSLPPALLFDGPAGVGKRTTAMAVAQAVNCVRPVPFRGAAQGGLDACGACPSCRRIARGSHPDVVLVEPEESGSIKIGTIREEVLQKTGYRPFEGRSRVFVVDEADALVFEAQDALLKTLEEPPAGSIFILVTSQAETLLPTVRSRVYRLRFGRLSEEEVVRVLREQHGVAEAEARVAAALSDGSVGRALAAQGGALAEARESAAGLLKSVASNRPAQRAEGAKILLAGPRSSTADRATLADRLRAAASMVRDLGILSSRAEDAWLANGDIREQLESLGPAFAAGRVLRAFASIDRALWALDRNASPKIVADWVAFEI